MPTANQPLHPLLPPGETIFTTCRLSGSVPAQALRHLHQQRQLTQAAARLAADPAEAWQMHRRAEKVFFAGFDALLDAGPVGPAFLEK